MKKFFILVLLILIPLAIYFLFFNTIKIPDFKNKTLTEVRTFSNKYKLNLKIKEEYSELGLNIVIDQNIKPNTKIKKGDTLIITISKGKNKDELYKKYNVNENGNIPVMMYHGIVDTTKTTKYGNVDADGYQRTKEAFIKDLEFYYQNNYRMIALKDYIDGNIKTEMSKSPIVITFDDGLENNIKVTGLDDNGNIVIDPNCAVGILESFKKKYPDYNITATFFLNSSLFNQDKYNDKIINYLINNNYDIGNHTYSHLDISKIDKNKTIEEVSKMYDTLKKYTDKYVNIVALPFGSPYDKAHSNFKYILENDYKNQNYQTKSTLRVGWESDLSPFNKDFDKTFIKRIRAYDNNGKEFDIKMNFGFLEKNRYISDGDSKKVVVKKEDKNNLKTNLEIVTY